MTQVLGPTAPASSSAAARDLLTRHYDEAHQAWQKHQTHISALIQDFQAGPGDEADHATRQSLLNEQVALTEAMRTHLDDLEGAIQRCDDSRYGICDGCRQAISLERLTLFPTATHCVSCKQRIEQR